MDSFAFFRADGAGAYGSRSNVTLQARRWGPVALVGLAGGAVGAACMPVRGSQPQPLACTSSGRLLLPHLCRERRSA